MRAFQKLVDKGGELLGRLTEQQQPIHEESNGKGVVPGPGPARTAAHGTPPLTGVSTKPPIPHDWPPGLPPSNTPPKGEELQFDVEVLGPQILRPGFVEIGRDGGGGGRVNGKNIVLFSDTLVKGWGPIVNTISYSDPASPAKLEDFGDDGVPRQGIPYTTEEKDYTDNGGGKTRVVVWPQSAIMELPGDPSRGIGIAPISIQSALGVFPPTQELYNSLYTIWTKDDGPVIERTVPKLWNDGEVLYGTFSAYLNPQDGMLYFFAADGTFHTPNTGLKVARSSLDSYDDKSRWQFWTGSCWADQPPKPNEAEAIIGGVYSSGDVFFSPFLGTYVAVYFLAIADNTFRYRYALPDENGKVSIVGKWSEDYVLYDTSGLRSGEGGYGFNYAGHAYPHYDKTGETLVLSITNSDGLTPMFLRAKFKRPV